jgi:uncharacterized tellurite resistance protein B-like protein
MINTLRQLFAPKPPAGKNLDPSLAVAALLIETALVDGVYVNIESDQIAEILLESFALDAAKVDRLMAEAEALAETAVGAHQFTKHVKRLSTPERVMVIETLYRVVFADDAMSAEEDAFVRHVASLLHVDDVARAGARQRARALRQGPG